MRAAIILIVALVVLGLAAVGVVATQNTTGPNVVAAVIDRVVKVASPAIGRFTAIISRAPSHEAPSAQTTSAQTTSAQATSAQAPNAQAPSAQIPNGQIAAAEGAKAPQAPHSPVSDLQAAVVAPSAASTSSAATVAPAAPGPVTPARFAQSAPNAAPPSPAAATPGATPPAAANAASAPAPIAACDKPGGIGLSRIVEIDTTGGPNFGYQHFKQYDFLRDKEVLLTFDDGPWPENTPAVLKALTDNCLKATFFEIGKHAMWHPEITKQVIEAGGTVGTHTWGHKDLARNPYVKDIDAAKAEIEMGVSAVHKAAGGPIAPFFRFPDLQQPPELLSYLAERNIAAFSTDIDSQDYRLRRPEQVIKSVMTQIEKRGRGIILLHDFKPATAAAMPELLRQLGAAGFKFVHMVPKQPVEALAKYDDMVNQQDKMSVNNIRPDTSSVRTIAQ